ncbi:YqcI/YcgG family protein [Mycobacterium hackensackense]|uniref:YqcI/YcgG family protein n=1 Tax=Mycobacterium hackensackense TaxID=228909 RepID=UPI0035570C57
MNVTKCPFAKNASVVFGPTWNRRCSFKGNVARHAVELRRFSRVLERDRLHGFVVKVGMRHRNPSFEGVRRTFREYLRALAETDLSCKESMEANLLSPDWQFTHSDTRYFLNVFASCYNPPHSKYIPTRYGFYIFFQPERSFDFCGRASLEEVKYHIRTAFARANMPYNGDLIDRRIESFLYMFPLQPFDSPVRWWSNCE